MECKELIELIRQESYGFKPYKKGLEFNITSPHIKVVTNYHPLENYLHHIIMISSLNRRIKIKDKNFDKNDLFGSFLNAFEKTDKQLRLTFRGYAFEQVFDEMIKHVCSRDERWVKLYGM